LSSVDSSDGFDVSNTDDVEEVTNYIAAYKLVRENLRDPKGLPISVRLMCEAHKLLLNGVRGTGKQPGDLLRSQNWIGGTRAGTRPISTCCFSEFSAAGAPRSCTALVGAKNVDAGSNPNRSFTL
jgi:Fic family protein